MIKYNTPDFINLILKLRNKMEKENDNFKIIDGKFKKLEANFAILKDTSTLWSE